MSKKQNEAATQGFGPADVAPSTASRMIAPLDIQQKEFRVSRFGGYKMRDVDEFLDQVTDAMTAVIAENERLRRRPGDAPVVGNSDLADVNRQADEMIQRARDEAARIVAEAREQAAALSGAGAAVAGSDVERAAIGAFLAREKEFLQSLAGLVQGHAEQVKTMARSARSAPPAAPRAPERATVAASASPATPEQAPSTTPAEVAEGAEVDEATSAPSVQVPSDEETVRVQDPEPARAGPGEPEAKDAADDSLRELFWGED